MGLRLVNTVPGALNDPMVPGKPFHLGLKSETGHVDPGSLKVLLGLTSLTRGTATPVADTALVDHGATAVLETTERRRPQVGTASASIVSNSLHIQKTDNLDTNLCVYEISHPIPLDASILGYFKIRTASWTLFSPDWADFTQMTGVYLGLEHGGFNTALYTFLRNTGAGSLIVGGPLSLLGGARPAEQEFSAFQWASLAADTVVEVWVFFNVIGYPSPFITPNIPVVEVWTKRAGVDAVPVVQARIPVSTLGQFPTGGSRNYRLGGDGVARLYIGNAGRSGDLLKVDDFALYPDFRFAVGEGVARPGTRLVSLPDGPVSYRSTDGLFPKDVVPGRWLPDGLFPKDDLRFFSEQNSAVRHYFMTKSVTGRMAYMKKEPRVEATSPVSSPDGAMVEAFMAGSVDATDGVLLGAGLTIDDGVKLYQTGMVQQNETRTYSLVRSIASQTSLGGHYLPTNDVDFRTMKLVRLVLDRRRGKVCVYVDEAKIIEKNLTDTLPNTGGNGGKVRFGHVFDSASRGRVDVRFVNYLSRYLAYEGSDGNLPPTAAVPFAAVTASDGSGSSVMDAGVLRIKKAAFGVSGSKRVFTRTHDFEEVGGLLLDVRMRVRDFTNSVGSPYPAESSTGVGVELYLGTKKIRLVFVNCGVFGKVVAVLPGSGSLQDILLQTTLGRSFSGKVDWTAMGNYRVVCRAGTALEVWATSVVNAPIISIPWRNNTDGFDLPADLTAPGIRLGHLDEDTSSISEWEHVRWGSSNGFEVAVSTEPPELSPYLFGGRSLIVSEFDE